MSRFRPAVVVLVALLAGCGPEGPHEFYRDALQARSELVDSLTFVVDEDSSKDFKHAEKRYKGRMNDLVEKMRMYKQKMSTDSGFQKLRREDFNPKKIDEDIMAAMIEGVRAYAEFTKNINYTNVRLAREIKRLNLVLEASVAKKIETQLEENAPVVDASAGDFQNLKFVVDTVNNLQDLGGLKFMPDMDQKTLERVEFGVDLKAVLEFKNDINVKIPDLEAPALPERPAWIDEAYRKLLERNRALPRLGGGGFNASYTPEQFVLKNVTGQNLTEVNGTLFYEAAGLKSSQKITEPNWPAGQTKQFQLPPADAKNLRLFGTAKVNGAPSTFDTLLPPAPKKKDDGS